MNNNMERWMMFFIGTATTSFIFGILASTVPEQTSLYRQGQIDALNGVIHYELQTQPDGSKIWKRKEK